MTDTRGTAGDQRASLTFLVVGADILLRNTTAFFLRDNGFDVIEAADPDEAICLLEHTTVDAIFCDVSMLGSLNALGLGRWLRRPGSSGTSLLTSSIEQTGEKGGERERTHPHRDVCDLLQ
jgi:CheY-like chemotaxis protein